LKANKHKFGFTPAKVKITILIHSSALVICHLMSMLLCDNCLFHKDFWLLLYQMQYELNTDDCNGMTFSLSLEKLNLFLLDKFRTFSVDEKYS